MIKTTAQDDKAVAVALDWLRQFWVANPTQRAAITEVANAIKAYPTFGGTRSALNRLHNVLSHADYRQVHLAVDLVRVRHNHP